MKAIVLYPKSEIFQSDADRVMPIEVPEFEEIEGRNGILEAIFRMMNAVDGSDVEKYLRQYKCRSMSVGDYVKVKGSWYIVKPVGWETVTRHETIDRLEKSVKASGNS